MIRPYLFRSITFKLWLILASAMLLALAITFAVIYYTTQKRFISYSFSLVKEQLVSLEAEILDAYALDKTFEHYRNSPRAWEKSLRQSLHFTRGSGFPPSNERPQRFKRDPQDDDYQYARPEDQHRNVYRAQKRFFQSLSLHDEKKQVIARGNIKPEQQYWHPVTIDGQIIAHVSFEKPSYVLKKREAIFLQQLALLFGKIAGFMIVASIMIAAILSRWFIAPVSRISRSASEVATGNLKTRVTYRANDELGELCQNFNEMCEKLESNEVARRQWLADISHEMRTPIAVLKAQIEAMLDGIRKPSRDNIQLLSRKIESLEQLINDLYDLSLSDTGDLNLDLQKIDFAIFVGQFIEDNKSRISSRGFEIEFNVEATDTHYILGDSFKLTQVLNNLLNNSLRYTDTPGKFTWILTTSEREIMLAVEDTSPGVDPTEIEKIFDRLYRVEKSRNRATGGAGLGLPLSRNIAKAHQGTLKATHSKFGGLKILFTLPRA